MKDVGNPSNFNAVQHHRAVQRAGELQEGQSSDGSLHAAARFKGGVLAYTRAVLAPGATLGPYANPWKSMQFPA